MTTLLTVVGVVVALLFLLGMGATFSEERRRARQRDKDWD